MRQSIRGYADGLIALAAPSGESSLTSLASELSAVRGVIDGSDDLRRALSDAGIAVAARRGVLNDLFSGQIGSTAMGLLNFVLDADRAVETVGDVDWLAERLAAANRNLEPVGDVVLGLKGAEERVDGFASAILKSVEDHRGLGEVEDELFRFSRIVAGSHDLRTALESRDLPADARRRIVTDLLQGKATAASTLLAAYLTKVGRPRDYQHLLGVVIDRVASESNRRLADVRSAIELDDRQQRDLAVALARIIGREVEIRVTVDPSVVAGFVASVGDTVVDASARHQLELLKERLVNPEVNITTGERH